MKNEVISLSDLSKKIGSQIILDRINLKIFSGDFAVIMGESGAGKTTLLNIISLLDSPDSGSYELYEQDVLHIAVNRKSQIRRDSFNIVFQQYNLFDELTIYENLDTYLKICEMQSHDIENKIMEVTQSLKLQDHLHKKVSVLSQGEKQRVAIARSFLGDKKLILADEPSASVDKENRDIIVQQLQDANSRGNTIIVVTHDKEYFNCATRKLCMSYGNISELD